MKAQTIARIAHCGQFDKVGTEYIEHPAAVVRILQTLPAYLDLTESLRKVARDVAWLHDVVEDTHLTAQDLLILGINPTVVNAVVAMSKVRGESLERYYERVLGNRIARVVKVADVTHNSNPDRLQCLDAATRQRLTDKYDRALFLLGEAQ